jgi:hypothetical protein
MGMDGSRNVYIWSTYMYVPVYEVYMEHNSNDMKYDTYPRDVFPCGVWNIPLGSYCTVPLYNILVHAPHHESALQTIGNPPLYSLHSPSSITLQYGQVIHNSDSRCQKKPPQLGLGSQIPELGRCPRPRVQGGLKRRGGA